MHYNVARVQYNNLFRTLNCINISPFFLHFPLDLVTRRQTHIMHVPSITVATMSTRKPITPASMKEMAVPLYSAVGASDEVAVVASVLAAVVASVEVAVVAPVVAAVVASVLAAVVASVEVAVVAPVVAAVVASVVAAWSIEDESNSKNCKPLCHVDPY